MSTETTKLNLHNDIKVNGRTYRAGQNIEVPKEQADDIARIDFEHQQYKDGLHKKRDDVTDLGTVGVGGN